MSISHRSTLRSPSILILFAPITVIYIPFHRCRADLGTLLCNVMKYSAGKLSERRVLAQAGDIIDRQRRVRKERKTDAHCTNGSRTDVPLQHQPDIEKTPSPTIHFSGNCRVSLPHAISEAATGPPRVDGTDSVPWISLKAYKIILADHCRG